MIFFKNIFNIRENILLMKLTNLAKRLLAGAGLWFIFWFIFFLVFKMHNSGAELANLSFSNPMLRKYLIQKTIIWFIVGIVWFITIHPFFKCKFPVFLRWLCIWTIISIWYWMSVFTNPNLENALAVFFMIVWAGAFIWMIIDLIITKLFWQGKDLHS